VRDVYDVCIGIDFKDDALECANEMIVSAVIGCERDDWPGHQSSAFNKNRNERYAKLIPR